MNSKQCTWMLNSELFCLFLQTPILFWPTIKQSNAPSPLAYADKATPVPITIIVEIEDGIPASSNTGGADVQIRT